MRREGMPRGGGREGRVELYETIGSWKGRGGGA